MIISALGKSIRYGNQVKALSSLLSGLSIHQVHPASNVVNTIIRTSTTSFFNKLPAEELWKGVTSVSNAGRKRGRASGGRKKHAKNLNKGQVIGVGKANILWPGLNSPVIRGKEVVQRQKLPEDPEREAKLIKIRSEMGGFRPLKLSPIERGWTGAKLGGRMLGPPDPVGEDNFEGFNSVVVEYKQVFNMTGNLGRKRQVSAFVVTGNGQGLAGFARGKAVEGKVALVTAKNRAGQKLMYIERYNNHTVMHDFFSQFGATKIFVKKKPEGYGLVCHRAIKSMCKVIGIKDMYAKIEGAVNIQNLTKAFFLGLIQQKTHEQLAEETGFHLVEFRKENGELPIVLASPSEPTKDREPPDFDQYIMDNRVVLQRKKFPPFYAELKGYKRHLWQKEKRRTHEKSRIQMIADYGKVRSFLGEKHPEAHLDYEWNKFMAAKHAKDQDQQ